MKYYFKEKNGWLFESGQSSYDEETVSICGDGIKRFLGLEILSKRQYILDVRLKNPKERGFRKICLGWNNNFYKLDINDSGLFLSLGAEQVVRGLFPDFRHKKIVLWVKLEMVDL